MGVQEEIQDVLRAFQRSGGFDPKRRASGEMLELTKKVSSILGSMGFHGATSTLDGSLIRLVGLEELLAIKDFCETLFQIADLDSTLDSIASKVSVKSVPELRLCSKELVRLRRDFRDKTNAHPSDERASVLAERLSEIEALERNVASAMNERKTYFTRESQPAAKEAYHTELTHQAARVIDEAFPDALLLRKNDPDAYRALVMNEVHLHEMRKFCEHIKSTPQGEIPRKALSVAIKRAGEYIDKMEQERARYASFPELKAHQAHEIVEMQQQKKAMQSVLNEMKREKHAIALKELYVGGSEGFRETLSRAVKYGDASMLKALLKIGKEGTVSVEKISAQEEVWDEKATADFGIFLTYFSALGASGAASICTRREAEQISDITMLGVDLGDETMIVLEAPGKPPYAFPLQSLPFVEIEACDRDLLNAIESQYVQGIRDRDFLYLPQRSSEDDRVPTIHDFDRMERVAREEEPKVWTPDYCSAIGYGEKCAINVYTGDGFDCINMVLRGRPELADAVKSGDLSSSQAIKETLYHSVMGMQALAKLRDHIRAHGGTKEVLFRGEGGGFFAYVLPHWERLIEVGGGLVPCTSFLSANKQRPAEDFVEQLLVPVEQKKGQNALVLIEGAASSPVRAWSQYSQSENEGLSPMPVLVVTHKKVVRLEVEDGKKYEVPLLFVRTPMK